MVHYDLPADPVLLEQRIGRLDRIGRTRPVEIVYFRHRDAHPDVARLFEQLDLFARPSAGLDIALGSVGDAVRDARREGAELDLTAIAAEVERARETHTRDLPRSFYPDAYDTSKAQGILDAVPPDLEERTQRFCIGAARELGLEAVEKGGAALYYMAIGRQARIESLPGVAEESRYLGTFDRAEAVRREEIEFFASGHPLVEGLLLELEDGPRGRACVIEIPGTGLEGGGLLLVRRSEAGWQPSTFDASGKPRPEWTQPVLDALAEARDADPEAWGIGEQWTERIRTLARRIELEPSELGAVAFFLFR
jgi:ATP-dependent helicase HepA